MKFFLKILVALSLIIVYGCSGNHLITDKSYLDIVEKSFNEIKKLAENRSAELFSVFDKNLSVSQIEGLKFLYAFMPLSDLADYNGEFFLANIDVSLRTKEDMPWGQDIPEDIFLHYILPLRVNNENLDSFRIVYYSEISERIRDKDIAEAALEINHWCHEKVIYQPSDIRTSAPMSTILSARGRCGEESTFTVAALRTAGIPSRQVYTPRWAHSDDNHAWVEVWINGKWFYMGACEPEPVLDQGWFTEPARRAMLVHTRSFGAPSGNENSIVSHKNYTEVNNLSKYAVTKKIFIKVLDIDQLPVNNAIVEYGLYNYAEFYPIAAVPTNEKGISQFETGLGDLLIWASMNDDFNFKKISVRYTDTLVLILNRKAEGNYTYDLDLDVPLIPSQLPLPSPELVKLNSDRINSEDIIRQNYINTWIDAEDTKELAAKLSIDSERTLNIISRSMGNYREIVYFLTNCPDTLRVKALSMLEILPDKDLRDTKEVILSDHLKYCLQPSSLMSDEGNTVYMNYILNPRVANELVTDWRSYLRTKLPSSLAESAYSDPSMIVRYIDENIKMMNNENYYNTPLTPKGVIDLKVADNHSRSIFFVAVCRSLGIPSRLEPGTNVPQYFFNNEWNNVYFSDQNYPAKSIGYLKLYSNDKDPVPEYYIHFTIARFDNGHYKTLEYDYNKKIGDFNNELALLPGNYMIVTGNRISDSKILSGISFFDLSANEHKTYEIKLRKDLTYRNSDGNLDLSSIMNLFYDRKGSVEKIGNDGTVILWIEPDKEPTKHILNDLPLFKKELDTWGGYFLFLTGSSPDSLALISETLPGLPENSIFRVNSQFVILKDCLQSLKISDKALPFVFVTDNKGNILYKSSGYRIGISEQILKYIR